MSMDRPDPEDLAAFDLSDYDPDNEEPMPCAALIPMTMMTQRDCRKPATNVYTHTLPSGVEIAYALCDEHAPPEEPS